MVTCWLASVLVCNIVQSRTPKRRKKWRLFLLLCDIETISLYWMIMSTWSICLKLKDKNMKDSTYGDPCLISDLTETITIKPYGKRDDVTTVLTWREDLPIIIEQQHARISPTYGMFVSQFVKNAIPVLWFPYQRTTIHTEVMYRIYVEPWLVGSPDIGHSWLCFTTQSWNALDKLIRCSILDLIFRLIQDSTRGVYKESIAENTRSHDLYQFITCISRELYTYHC